MNILKYLNKKQGITAMRYFAYMFAAMLLLASCSDYQETEVVTDVAVVESYLVPGENASVKLYQMIPFTDEEYTGPVTIDSAEVYIETDGKEYLLTPVDTVPGYYVCLDTSMVVEADKDYILTFDHNGTEVSAATTVPPKPQDLSLSDIYYYYDPYGSLPGYTDPLEIYWDNTDGAYYQIVVEYLDETYKPISEYLDPNSYDSYRVIASGALSGDTYSLMPRRQLAFYGDYKLTLYRINDEYVNLLYSGTDQSTLSITEPQTNVKNGLGIFTGINLDVIYFKVIKI